MEIENLGCLYEIQVEISFLISRCSKHGLFVMYVVASRADCVTENGETKAILPEFTSTLEGVKKPLG